MIRYLMGGSPRSVRYFKSSALEMTSTLDEATDVDGQKGERFPLSIVCHGSGIEVLAPVPHRSDDTKKTPVMKNNDGIKRTSIDRLKLLSGTSYRSGDIVITPLMSLKNLNDITTLIQGVTIGVTVSGTTRLRINGKPYELRPNTLFIFNENTVIEQVKASIRSSGYMLTYSRSYLNRIHVDTQDVISIYHGFMGEPCITVDPDEASYINDLSKLMRATLAAMPRRPTATACWPRCSPPCSTMSWA